MNGLRRAPFRLGLFLAMTQTAFPLSVYLIGNSLTDNVYYQGLAMLAQSRGLTHTWNRQMIPGAPIEWLWEHPNDGFKEEPYGYPRQAFKDYSWDALTLQPFTRPLENDVTHAQNFIDLAKPKSPGIQVYIYAQWPSIKASGSDFQAHWVKPYVNTPQSPYYANNTQATADYYERVVHELRKGNPGMKPALLIPVGHVMHALDKRMKAGEVEGFNGIFQVYTDDIHLGNVGAYIVACTFFASLYRQSPVGLPSGAPYHVGGKLAGIIQETVWKTVLGHPLAGAVPVGVAIQPDPNQAGSPAGQGTLRTYDVRGRIHHGRRPGRLPGRNDFPAAIPGRKQYLKGGPAIGGG